MQENRVIIAGSRDFEDFEIAERAIFEAFRNIDIIGPVRIVSGHCRGADMLGERLAEKYGLAISLFPAEWSRYGRRAGFIRNSTMASFAGEDNCRGDLIAFWDGESKGTGMMIGLAKRKGLRVHVFDLQGRAYG